MSVLMSTYPPLPLLILGPFSLRVSSLFSSKSYSICAGRLDSDSPWAVLFVSLRVHEGEPLYVGLQPFSLFFSSFPVDHLGGDWAKATAVFIRYCSGL